MSVEAALQFIKAVRQDKKLKSQIQRLVHPLSAEELVQIGKDAGFDYTEAELQTAYKQDWIVQSFSDGSMQLSNRSIFNSGSEQESLPCAESTETDDFQYLEAVRRYYDKMTPVILKDLGQTYQAGLLVTDLDSDPYLATNLYCAAQAGIQSGHRVLDAGCGVCGPSIDIARNIKDVKIDAITISPVQADNARKLVQEAGIADSINVYVGDYHHLPFADEMFDIFFSLEGIGYSYDLQRLFSEAYRVLRPGGRLYIKDLFVKEPPLSEHEQLEFIEFNRIYVYKGPCVSETVAAISEAGFQAVDSCDLTKITSTEEFAKAMFKDKGLFQTLTDFGRLHYRNFQCLPFYFAEIKAHKL